MKIENLHSWQVSTAEAFEIQRRLASQVSKSHEKITPRFIAGVDSSSKKPRGTARGAAVVVSYPALRVVEGKVVESELSFPYVPGLLSFRELPLILAACEQLTFNPDIFLVDGHGIAHPRRMGIASHLGLLLHAPTIGCAKSLLCGTHEEPLEEPGSYTEIIDKDETIGAALRTKTSVKPVYVSIGHRIDLKTAMHWVLACCNGYRLPEPIRFAHLAAKGT